MKKKSRLFAFVIIPSFLLGTFFTSLAFAGDPLKVTVSIVPQKYFVKKIAGDLVDVSVMVLPGANPATYEPKPQQMVGLTKSRIYFAIGVPFETVWLGKYESFNPEMTIVATQAGIEKIPMKAHLHNNEKGGADNKTTAHAAIKDPHIWLSPPLVMLQARNILDGFLKVDPAHRETYEDNYKKFISEVVELDLKIRNQFIGTDQGTRFMVYHPAWGYFARAYGLKQIPVEIEGKEPTPKVLQRLIHNAKKDGIRVIFVQPQFSTKSANTIARAIKGQVMFADPLELDWALNLSKVVKGFASALK
ncbi:MAG: zinc ABC transporter substrate-binding protein [Desulfobacteraceae bacterium]|nr:zinc ABC transporter substrate-binding protein [Desulfobacteraceae bacterium]